MKLFTAKISVLTVTESISSLPYVIQLHVYQYISQQDQADWHYIKFDTYCLHSSCSPCGVTSWGQPTPMQVKWIKLDLDWHFNDKQNEKCLQECHHWRAVVAIYNLLNRTIYWHLTPIHVKSWFAQTHFRLFQWTIIISCIYMPKALLW